LKVDKEEIVAMWVALEHYLKRDHQKDWSEWEERVRVMASGLAAARGVGTERFVPEIANQVPHLRTPTPCSNFAKAILRSSRFPVPM